MSRTSLVSTVRNIWKTLTRKNETPKEAQERLDLYKVALASTYRELRLAAKMGDSLSSTNKEELGKLFDQASESLDTEAQVHDLPLRSLRFHVQSSIQPQITSILQTCKDIDIRLDLPENEENQKEVSDICKPHLLQERDNIINQLENSKESHTHAKENQRAYLEQKLNALQIISAFYAWESDTTDNDLPIGTADSFGYYISEDNEINESIRYYQMINLTKALLIKEHLGYATLALKSTLPEAGRGVFVDGFAPAGSLISFFPGKIWPKEYLLNVKAVSPIFKDDQRHQLSIRYDDILIDSRREPYTVLDNENSNAFAIGHIVNHPPKTVSPNCSTTMIDFLESMNLKKAGLDRYVPNTYAKQPMMLGPNAMDRELVSMHGFGLIASRDLENEELFYDYRLSTGENASYPEWYNVCDEDELKNRWDTQS